MAKPSSKYALTKSISPTFICCKLVYPINLSFSGCDQKWIRWKGDRIQTGRRRRRRGRRRMFECSLRDVDGSQVPRFYPDWATFQSPITSSEATRRLLFLWMMNGCVFLSYGVQCCHG